MKKLLAILVVLWAGGALGYYYYNDPGSRRIAYRTVPVARGDLRATINATGTIEPEEVVDVGVQVAGEVRSFGADPRDPSKSISYGTPVEKGTVLARLDDALFKSRVGQARAGVVKAEADVEQARVKVDQARRELDRKEELKRRGNRGLVSGQEYDDAIAGHETAKAALIVSKAAVEVARASLDEAEVNLRFATITSPVKGVILDRRVNVGQVASLGAPHLFLIARDLSKMEIWASVNETDIGAIHVGQPVRFTVAAHAGKEFPGHVSQIRLNASMNSGVVTYIVVVGFDNPGGKLMPYLTARLQFEVRDRKAVLLVPNAALRWQPKPGEIDPAALAEAAALRRRQDRPAADEQAKARPATESESEAESRSESESESESAPPPAVPGVLWIRSGADFVRPVPVEVGPTDGIHTEVSAAGLKEGAQVIVGIRPREEQGETSAIYDPKKFQRKMK